MVYAKPSISSINLVTLPTQIRPPGNYLLNKDVGISNKCKFMTNIFDRGRLITDPLVIINSLNNYFVNIEDELVNHNKCGSHSHHTANEYINSQIPKFVFKTISEQELDKIISLFQNKMFSGVDEISIVLVKKTKDEIIKPFIHVDNASLISGLFPNKLKIAKIIPI